jgi:hypothetical protein
LSRLKTGICCRGGEKMKGAFTPNQQKKNQELIDVRLIQEAKYEKTKGIHKYL